MTIKELNQYRFYLKEYEDLANRIHEETVIECVSGSMSEFPFIKGSRIIEGVPENYSKKLQQAYDKAYLELLKLNEFIETINNPAIRLAIRTRFVDGFSWNKVADTLGGGNTEDSVKKMCYRYIQREK